MLHLPSTTTLALIAVVLAVLVSAYYRLVRFIQSCKTLQSRMENFPTAFQSVDALFDGNDWVRSDYLRRSQSWFAAVVDKREHGALAALVVSDMSKAERLLVKAKRRTEYCLATIKVATLLGREGKD